MRLLSILLAVSVLCLSGQNIYAEDAQNNQNNQNDKVVNAESDSAEGSSRVPVSTGKYITGGILGSALGFGIGHGVQGRYAEKGWIFTAADSVGMAILLSGAKKCVDEKNADSTLTECSSASRGQMLAGYVTFIGFHVWEVVDVWTGARPVDNEKTSAFILPTPEATTVGFVYRF